jgi:phospholipid transport system substrate-binding protein
LVDNPQATPNALIGQATRTVLEFLKIHRQSLRLHPHRTALLLAGQLLPYFDFSLTAQYVLGRYWRSATPEERNHFQMFFYHYLIHTFATALRHYQGARVQVKPYRGSLAVHYVQVMSEIRTHGGRAVGVTYALYHTAHGWRIFDVSVEGISYVMSFRRQFEPILERVGVAGLIRELRKKAIRPVAGSPSR